MAFFNFDFDRLQSIMNGAGNVIPPSVDGNIHPEVAAKNLGTNYRSRHPELIYGFRNSYFMNSNSMNRVPTTARAAVYSGTSGDFGAAAPTAKALDYLNAELAQHYGMSKTTAYQEALSNTSYQRAVKDMRDAGLNPAVLFGTGRGQSANSSIYASEAAAGGGGGGRSYGGSSGNGKLFSSSVYSAIANLSGLVTAVVTKKPGNFWIGSQTAKGAMGLADAISKLNKK